MSTKTTEADFRQYVAHCKYWMTRLSIGQYSYAFVVDDIERDASITTNDEMSALVRLGVNREDFYSVPWLARHEMLEVLVDDSFRELYQTYNNEYIQEKRHRLIHRLEKILPLPTDKEVGFVGCGKKKKPKGK